MFQVLGWTGLMGGQIHPQKSKPIPSTVYTVLIQGRVSLEIPQ